MMNFAFLPELAAAAIGLAAVRLGDRIQTPSHKREKCREPRRKTLVWAYNPFRAAQRETHSEAQTGGWTPVHRTGGC